MILDSLHERVSCDAEESQCKAEATILKGDYREKQIARGVLVEGYRILARGEAHRNPIRVV